MKCHISLELKNHKKKIVKFSKLMTLIYLKGFICVIQSLKNVLNHKKWFLEKKKVILGVKVKKKKVILGWKGDFGKKMIANFDWYS